MMGSIMPGCPEEAEQGIHLSSCPADTLLTMQETPYSNSSSQLWNFWP